MATFVALLRAVNVGGTGKLAMRDLVVLCEEIGFTNVSTYIQSGNVVFKSRSGEARVKALLEKALASKMGKPARTIIRECSEFVKVEKRNPYTKAAPNQVLVVFLDKAPGKGAVKDLVIPGREQVTVKGREVFIHYPDGVGRSKLKTSFTDEGTARNLNTVRKLVAMAESLS